jgi:hypothetical protein
LFDYLKVCKSCLVKHLEEHNTCPTCEIVIHQSHPLQYISFDRTMQDIVYKLVPNLQQSITYLSINLIFNSFNVLFINSQMKLKEKEIFIGVGESRTRRQTQTIRSARKTSILFNQILTPKKRTVIVTEVTNRWTFF